MKLKHFLSVSVLLFSALQLQATVYYASPTGTDATGTSKAAPGSITAMIGKLKAGDQLILLDGQYDLKNLIKISQSGTADQYITIVADDGAKPILDFRELPNGKNQNAIQLTGNYFHLKGFTVRYSGYKGIWVEKGKYNILENLEVYGCCDSGIQLRSGGHNMVINCDSHDNFDYQNNGSNADGFADKQGDACAGNVYIGCRSWNNSDDGWDSYERVTDGTPTVYINCITYNNGPASFNLTNHPRVKGVDAGLDCFNGKDLANFPNGGNPNGFKLGGKGTAHNTELYRCLAVNHRSKGFDQNNNAGKMKIVNCTAYLNKLNYGFGNDYAYTLDIHNCISFEPGDGAKGHLVTAKKGTVTQSHNTWNDGFSVSDADFESLDVENLILSPRNADGSLAETLLLHLKSTSALIDKGMIYEASRFEGDQIGKYVAYKGAAPDLGCYEYDASPSAIETLTFDDIKFLNPNAPCYNLQGRRVDASYKGIIIQSGRKFLSK